MRSWLDFQEAPLGETEVSLGALFNEICELIAQHEPKWSPEWKRALDDALNVLLARSLDDETLEGCHLQQKAALFLRLEMETERLKAYVRDPATEKAIALRPEDWMQFSPQPYIPAGDDGNFIFDGHYGVTGADGTRFYAELSSAFVNRHQIKVLINRRLVRSHNNAPQASLVMQALCALWNGDIPDMPAKIRDFKIREWARENKKAPPSKATIKRVIRLIELDGKPEI
jgi:hypothetical protein